MQDPLVSQLREKRNARDGGRTGPPPLPFRTRPPSVDQSTAQASPTELTREIAALAGPEKSGVERFMEAFLQERNIKWMLGLGVLILLGSSLMFVLEQWQTMGTFWQYSVMLGYTGLVHLCGQTAYHRLGLRKTGTGLMALTLLLIPLAFLSLKWIAVDKAIQGLAFLVPTLLFSAMAARRIFGHFLRGDRPTVLVSYLSLALMGAVAPALLTALQWPMLWAFATWAVFAVGSVKANREVFWLVEEHRMPRIFGFFPIALFAMQFLAVFSLHFMGGFAANWIGFGCVLMAIPVLLTADVVAGVFRQRTGDLVRPLPWPIIGPIVVGLILCVVGVGLSATGFPSFALVPASAMFALIMGVMAHRTGKRGFTWAMLFGVVMAYQFSPIFFKELAVSLIQQAASAVNKQKLPLAYYGLTYMPLLFVCSLASRFLRGRELFSLPLQRFTVGMSVALLAASFSEPGANFMVAAAMMVFFVWQAFLFRMPEASLFGVVASITAAARLVPFANEVWHLGWSSEVTVFCLGGMAIVMQLFGRKIDSAVRFDVSARRLPGWYAAALPVTFIAIGTWLFFLMPTYLHHPALWSGGMLTAVLVGQALLSPKRGFGECAIGFGLLLGGLQMAAMRFPPPNVALAETVALFGLWVFRELTTKRTDRFAIAFSKPARNLSFAMIGVAAASTIWAVVGYGIVGMPCNWVMVATGVLAVSWCLLSGRRHPALSALGLIALMGIEWVPVGELLNAEWISVAWATTAVLALVATRREKGGHFNQVEAISLIVLTLLATASFVIFSLPMSVAGGIALVGFMLHGTASNNTGLRSFSLAMLNWQLVALILRLLCPDVPNILALGARNLANAALPLAAVTAVSYAFFGQTRFRKTPASGDNGSADVFELHRFLIATASVICLVLSLTRNAPILTPIEWACAAITFLVPATQLWRTAHATKQASYVWGMLSLTTAFVAYLSLHGAIQLTHASNMFVVLGAATVAFLTARHARKREREFIAAPLFAVARALPMVTVGIAMVRFMKGSDFALNSLAALLAAAYYFWCGLEEKRRRLIVLSAVITNAVWALVCRRLSFEDPQFFMVPIGFSVIGLVEMLKREIPQKMRNPLRYGGALMILVTPAFNLVGGNWLQLLSLMVFSVLTALAAIGLRARALLYTGTAFLIADLIAMVVKGVNAHHELLWLGGLLAGGAVIAMAALFENHREELLSRVRTMATTLEAWD